MTGVSSNNPQFQDPAFLANPEQQKIDDQKTVTTGPGGSTGAPIVSIGDMITRFVGPANQGMTGSSKDLNVTGNINAADPNLSIPETAPFSVSLSMLSSFANSLTVPDTKIDDSEGLESFGFSFGGGDGPLDTGLTMAVPADLQSLEKDKVFAGLLAYTGIEANAGLTDDQKASFKEQLHVMADQIAAKNAEGPIPELASGNVQQISNYLSSLIPPNSLKVGDLEAFQATLDTAATTITAGQYTGPLLSTQKDEVLSALMAFTDISTNPTLTDLQRETLLAKLDELATAMAEQNASGTPDPALTSFDSKTISTYLALQVDLSGLSEDDKMAFTSSLEGAGNSISAINAASGILPPKGAILEGMASTDESVVLKAMNDMLAGQNLSAGQLADIEGELPGIAAAIAQKNGTPGGSGLDITDAASMKAALIALLGSKIDPANPKQLAALNALATAFAAQNTTFYSQLAKSTDPNVVFDALRHLSNIDHNPNLTPAEKQAGLTYLKLMASALAFMSSVRAKIAMLEAELRKAENEGKLATIRDQTKLATQKLTAGLQKIAVDLQKALDGIKQEAMMKWLGPFIIVILAIIAIILACIPYGGAAASAAVIAVMVAVIVVVTVVIVVDMATGFIEKLAKMTSKNKVAQDAFKFSFQAILMVLVAIVTFGAGGVLMSAVNTARQTIMEALKQMLQEGLKKILQLMILEAVSMLVSSGLLTDALVPMFQAMGMSKKDAETAAMVLSIIITLVCAIVTGRMTAVPKLDAKSFTGAVKGAFEQLKTMIDDFFSMITNPKNFSRAAKAADAAKDSTDDALKIFADAADSAGDVAKVQVKVAENSIGDTLKDVAKNLQKKLTQMAELAKDPDSILVFMQALGSLAQIGQGLGNAVNEFQLAKLVEGQAHLATVSAEFEALLEYLKQVMNQFDMTQQDLDNSSKDFLKMYNELMALFADMVSSASAIVSETAAAA